MMKSLCAALAVAALAAGCVSTSGISTFAPGTPREQVLTENEFNRIVPGQWTRADVEREFGPPARVDGVASWNGPILTYRWRDLQGANMFYWVYLDPEGVVRRAHPGMEFRDRLFDRF